MLDEEIVNAIMQSPFWSSTVIFLTWDDWERVHRPRPAVVPVDRNGYGIRVPGIAISPWVKPGLIDKQVLSQDAYLKFIEDLFTNGQQLDGGNGGRPDDRPTNREGREPARRPALQVRLRRRRRTRRSSRAPCPTQRRHDFTRMPAGPCQP